jgi:hypothetical protein
LNCRWATRKEQNNNKRGARLITWNDQTHTLAEWSKITGLHKFTIEWRLKRGWPVGDVMTRPVRATTKSVADGLLAFGNSRRIFLTHNGVTRSASEWADIIGVSRATITWRMKQGWPVEKILGPNHNHLPRVRWSPKEKKIWNNMMSHCYNQHHLKYPIYGGRGITVCLGLRNLPGFFSVMGNRPSINHKLKLIDSERGYWCGQCEECKSLDRKTNCHWATEEQQPHRRRPVVALHHDGKEYSVAELAAATGFNETGVYKRIKMGWTAAQILAARPRKYTRRSA